MSVKEAAPSFSPRNRSRFLGSCRHDRCARGRAATSHLPRLLHTNRRARRIRGIAYCDTGKLPNAAELANYKAKLRSSRVPRWSERLARSSGLASDGRHAPAARRRTVRPEKDAKISPAARDIADALACSAPSFLYWYPTATRRRIESNRRRSVGRALPSSLHGNAPKNVGARDDTSLTLRRARVNASTFAARVVAGTVSDMYSAITARSALFAAEHGGSN